jgi:hypothetical protein
MAPPPRGRFDRFPIIFKSQAAGYNVEKSHDNPGMGNNVPPFAAHDEEETR